MRCVLASQRAIQLADRHGWGSCAVPGPRPRSCSATQAGGCPPCLRPGPGTLQAPTEHPLSQRGPHTLVRTSVASLCHSVALVPCPQHLLQPAGQPLLADDKLRPGPQSCLQALTPVEQFPGGSVCLSAPLLLLGATLPRRCFLRKRDPGGLGHSGVLGSRWDHPWTMGWCGIRGDRSLSPACVGRPLGCLGPHPRTDGLFLASWGNPRRAPARTSSCPLTPACRLQPWGWGHRPERPAYPLSLGQERRKAEPVAKGVGVTRVPGRPRQRPRPPRCGRPQGPPSSRSPERRWPPDLRRAGRGAVGVPTLTLPKSSCVCRVYICSVRSILWAPSLHRLTSCEAGVGRAGCAVGSGPAAPAPPPPPRARPSCFSSTPSVKSWRRTVRKPSLPPGLALRVSTAGWG